MDFLLLRLHSGDVIFDQCRRLVEGGGGEGGGGRCLDAFSSIADKVNRVYWKQQRRRVKSNKVGEMAYGGTA